MSAVACTRIAEDDEAARREVVRHGRTPGECDGVARERDGTRHRHQRIGVTRAAGEREQEAHRPPLSCSAGDTMPRNLARPATRKSRPAR
jgi:hypothetical protein